MLAQFRREQKLLFLFFVDEGCAFKFVQETNGKNAKMSFLDDSYFKILLTFIAL